LPGICEVHVLLLKSILHACIETVERSGISFSHNMSNSTEFRDESVHCSGAGLNTLRLLNCFDNCKAHRNFEGQAQKEGSSQMYLSFQYSLVKLKLSKSKGR